MRHDDIVPMTTLACDVIWLESYMTTLNYHENVMYRTQQIQYALLNTINEMGI